jgi:hypothetical protein
LPENRAVTSISIDQDLWKQARKFAIDKDITLSNLLELSLTNFMKNPPEQLLQETAASVAESRSGAASKAWDTRRSKNKKH